jgi:ABC-2 type transport system permease protein
VSISMVFKIADHEFYKLLRNPLMIIFIAILTALLIVFSIGSSINLSTNGQKLYPLPVANFMTYGLQNTFYETSYMLATLAMCLGVFAIADERANGSLRVLLCKPLYRRDVMMGKFLGNSEFMFLLAAFSLTMLTSLTLMLYPLSFGSLLEVAIRVVTYILLMFLMCMMTFSMTMLIGVLFKNIILSLLLSASLIYVQWFNYLFGILQGLSIFIPNNLYIFTILDNNSIFDVALPFDQWFLLSLPYIILMILEVCLLLIISAFVFNREEG